LKKALGSIDVLPDQYALINSSRSFVWLNTNSALLGFDLSILTIGKYRDTTTAKHKSDILIVFSFLLSIKKATL
jgi:hypothetical protein